jgi:Xaa-Pro aminopeptidase
MSADYSTRLERAAAALASSGIDGLLLTPGADMTYLTGFQHGHAMRRLLALVLSADGAANWIAPTMNVAQMRDHGIDGNIIRAWTDAETYFPPLREATLGMRSLAFDEETRAAFLMDLLSIVPDMRVEKAGDIIGRLRQCKDAVELATLRAAGATVDQTIPEAIALCRPGKRECDIDEELRAALLRRSPESAVAFTIVASGPNGALPHHDTGTRALQPGDCVILDYGTRLNGYHSDITVTCSVGEPADQDVRKVYRVVWEAQQRALEAVRPGARCEDVDRAARDHITAAGYGEFFIHRTGHGLGMQVHEPPFIVGGNTAPLEEGMVFSVEPGIYLPGRFGVRLEVITAVGASGPELINAPRVGELPVVEWD